MYEPLKLLELKILNWVKTILKGREGILKCVKKMGDIKELLLSWVSDGPIISFYYSLFTITILKFSMLKH